MPFAEPGFEPKWSSDQSVFLGEYRGGACSISNELSGGIVLFVSSVGNDPTRWSP